MKYRKRLINWLFEISQRVYTSLFKNHKPWNISRDELLTYPKTSIGWHLGKFLETNDFELIPKVERHDAYHTITGFGTCVEDEIALQYLCFGNGKRSPYLYGAMILGTIILPDYYKYYFKAYQLGKAAHSFHHYDFSRLLSISLESFRATIFTPALRQQLKSLKHEQIQTVL